MQKKIRQIVFAGVLAALYAALTIILSFMSFGPIQFRIAEALTVLPYFSPFAIAGLSVGCFVSGLIASPYMWADILFGTFATLLGAVCTYLLSKKQNKVTFFLAPLPTVLANTFIIGAVITLFTPDVSASLPAFFMNSATVGLGEIVCCYGLGLPLMYFIKKHRGALPF